MKDAYGLPLPTGRFPWPIAYSLQLYLGVTGGPGQVDGTDLKHLKRGQALPMNRYLEFRILSGPEAFG